MVEICKGIKMNTEQLENEHKKQYEQAIEVLQMFEVLSKNQPDVFAAHVQRLNGLKFLAERMLKLYRYELEKTLDKEVEPKVENI